MPGFVDSHTHLIYPPRGDRGLDRESAARAMRAAGLAEAMRAESAKKTRFAYLSRALAGVRAESLIINLPGSPKACVETLEILAPLLPHAVETLRGDVRQHKIT